MFAASDRPVTAPNLSPGAYFIQSDGTFRKLTQEEIAAVKELSAFLGEKPRVLFESIGGLLVR